jgi:hypothetical protein
MCHNAGQLSLRHNSTFNTARKHKNLYYRGLSAIVFGGCSCYMVYNVYNNKLWTREGRRIFLVKLGGIQRFLRWVLNNDINLLIS